MFKNGAPRFFLTLSLSAFLGAGASSQETNPEAVEIGTELGYSRVIAVESVPDPATFTLEIINRRNVVMGGRFGVRYLLTFGHNCPEAGFGNVFDTTANGGELSVKDSIVIDKDVWCQIEEIHVLE